MEIFSLVSDENQTQHHQKCRISDCIEWNNKQHHIFLFKDRLSNSCGQHGPLGLQRKRENNRKEHIFREWSSFSFTSAYSVYKKSHLHVYNALDAQK